LRFFISNHENTEPNCFKRGKACKAVRAVIKLIEVMSIFYGKNANAQKRECTKRNLSGLWISLWLLLLCSTHFTYGQALEHGVLPKPLLWVKADSAVLGATQWGDISGNGYNLLPQSGTLPEQFARLNFNKAFELDNEYFTASGLPFANRDMTAIVLYRIADTAEQALWQIPVDSNRVGLTSRQLLGTWGDMHYRDSNEQITIVHTLFRNWKRTNGLSESYDFQLLKADSLPFYGRVSECLLFDWHIDDTTLVQYISYLSLKYGITLFETDYLSSSKRMIWDYHNHPAYSYSIAGLGRDDTLGLYQKQSYMLDEKIVTGLNELAATNEDNSGILANGDYMIWGFDSSLLERTGMIYLDNGEEFEVYGNGLYAGTRNAGGQNAEEQNAEGENAEGQNAGGQNAEEQNAEGENVALYTFMTVDGSSWNGTIENYYLLIDRSGTGEFRPEDIVFYMPDFVDTNSILHFSNIQWDTDNNGSDRFCFTYVPVDTILSNRNLVMNSGDRGQKDRGQKDEGAKGQKERIKDKKEAGIKAEEGNAYRVYPNPSERDFVLEVDFVQQSDIMVKLFNPEGKIMDRQTAAGRKNYRFPYQLSVSGQYLLEISGGGETRTLKVVINK
jgi:hypothetical protein